MNAKITAINKTKENTNVFPILLFLLGNKPNLKNQKPSMHSKYTDIK